MRRGVVDHVQVLEDLENLVSRRVPCDDDVTGWCAEYLDQRDTGEKLDRPC